VGASPIFQTQSFRLKTFSLINLQACGTAEVLPIIRAAVFCNDSPSTSFLVANSRHDAGSFGVLSRASLSLDTCLSTLASDAFPRGPHDGRFHHTARGANAFARSAAMLASRRHPAFRLRRSSKRPRMRACLPANGPQCLNRPRRAFIHPQCPAPGRKARYAQHPQHR